VIRRGALLAVGLVVLLAAGWLSATGAEAASPRECVTHAEGNRLRHGMVPSEVERVVGFKGKRHPVVSGVPKWDIPAHLEIDYRVCDGAHPLIVMFEDRDGMWRLQWKVSPWHGGNFGD